MSRCSTASVIVLAALAMASATASAQTIRFADADAGSLPKDFESALTGRGTAGRWTVVEDSEAEGGKALAQISTDRTDYRFPLAIYKLTDALNVDATIRFKPVSGKVDRSGGVVVRYRDAGNYYVARANALEDNVRFYRVVKGTREQLGTADVKVAGGQWHVLMLRAEGDRFTISFNGNRLYTVTDGTFLVPGKMGLWTKADSVTRFDRLEIRTLP